MDRESPTHLEGLKQGIPWIQSDHHGLGISRREFHGSGVSSMVLGSQGRNSMDSELIPSFGDLQEGIPWIQSHFHGLGIPLREFHGFPVKTMPGRSPGGNSRITSVVWGSLGGNSMDVESKLHLGGDLQEGIPWIQGHLQVWRVLSRESHGFRVTSVVWGSQGGNSMDSVSPPYFPSQGPSRGVNSQGKAALPPCPGFCGNGEVKSRELLRTGRSRERNQSPCWDGELSFPG